MSTPAPQPSAVSTAPAERAAVAVPPRWLRVLKSMEPASLLFNPVFQREMRSTSRNLWTFYNRTIMLLTLLLIAFIGYLSVAERAGAGVTGIERVEALQRIAPELFSPLAWIQFAVIIFIAQSLTAPAINQERQRRSFPMLAVSPLTAGQIVFGTLAARMTQVIILTLIMLPMLLALRVFGGLDTETIVSVMLITLTTGILAGALGILCSVLSQRPAGASALAMGLMVLVCAGPPLAYAMWGKLTGSPGSIWWVLLSPAGAMATIMFGPPRAGAGSWLDWLPFMSAGVNLGLALLSCLIATSLVRPLILREAVSEGAKTNTRRSRRRVMATPTPVVAMAADSTTDTAAVLERAELAIEEHSGSRRVGERPVLWRELRQTVFKSGLRRAIALIALGIALVWINWLYGVGTEDSVISLTISLTVIFVLLGTSGGTGSITGEVESRTWPVLLTTPLTPHEILMGKIIGTLRRMWIAPTAILLVQLVGFVRGNVHPALLVITVAVMLGTGVLLSTTGVVFSLMARRTSSASAFNFAFAGLLWVGSLVLIGTISAIAGIRSEPAAFGLALAINPVALMSMSAIALVDNAGHFHGSHLGLPGLWRNMDAWSFTAVTIVYLALCCAFSWLAITFAAARWNRYTARRLG